MKLLAVFAAIFTVTMALLFGWMEFASALTINAGDWVLGLITYVLVIKPKASLVRCIPTQVNFPPGRTESTMRHAA